MRTALIDADIIVYRAAWAVQKTHYTHKETGEFFDGKAKAKKWLTEAFDMKVSKEYVWEDEWDMVEEIEPWKNCQFLLDNFVAGIMKGTQADNKVLYLSPSSTFRHVLEVDTRIYIPPELEYKGNRADSPHFKDQAREYLIKRYHAEVGKNIEADDMLGLNQNEDTVIASIDKDLLMIAGKHYDILSEERTLVGKNQGDRWFFAQLIAGDRVDNMKGIPGYGVKTAKKLVDSLAWENDYSDLVEKIEDLYDEHYEVDSHDGTINSGRPAMLAMAQLVYILQVGDTPGKEKWRTLLGV
jgi:hypothetical protein